MAEPDPAGTPASEASRLAIAGVAGFGALTVVWFVVSWVFLNSSIVDALGEAVGGVMLVLLIVSIVGALGRAR
ncbi:MAG: hypothetical protein KJO75_14835 [Dactylosporangium sp.]|nr:hypothetical protein [Dactylosporangium sp.]